MKRKRLAGVLALAMLCGCDAGTPSKTAAFKNAQRNAMTPHGKIDLESVRETSDGQISYTTTDGSRWTVSMDYAADGKPRFDQPVRQSD